MAMKHYAFLRRTQRTPLPSALDGYRWIPQRLVHQRDNKVNAVAWLLTLDSESVVGHVPRRYGQGTVDKAMVLNGSDMVTKGYMHQRIKEGMDLFFVLLSTLNCDGTHWNKTIKLSNGLHSHSALDTYNSLSMWSSSTVVILGTDVIRTKCHPCYLQTTNYQLNNQCRTVNTLGATTVDSKQSNKRTKGKERSFNSATLHAIDDRQTQRRIWDQSERTLIVSSQSLFGWYSPWVWWWWKAMTSTHYDLTKDEQAWTQSQGREKTVCHYTNNQYINIYQTRVQEWGCHACYYANVLLSTEQITGKGMTTINTSAKKRKLHRRNEKEVWRKQYNPTHKKTEKRSEKWFERIFCRGLRVYIKSSIKIDMGTARPWVSSNHVERWVQ